MEDVDIQIDLEQFEIMLKNLRETQNWQVISIPELMEISGKNTKIIDNISW